MADPLASLLRIRKLAVEEAKRDLAGAVAAAEQAREAARAARDRIDSEAEMAADIDADDDVVASYAQWLPLGRERAARAVALLEARETDLERSRATLTAAQAAADAVNNLLVARAASAASKRLSRFQSRSDDVAAAQRALADEPRRR